MKRLFFVLAGFYLLASTACNNEEAKPDETIVKDSMGVTQSPVTDQVDSLAADTLSTATTPEKSADAALAPNISTTTENYTSSTGQAVTAVYDNTQQISFVTLTVEGKEIKLTQTESWAKGGEYSNGKIKWTAKGNEATLNMDGKETKYTVKK